MSDHADDALQGMTSNSECAFLVKLPREIRDIIYGYALQYDTPVEAEDGGWQSAPGLLKTCKQISEEATTLFYNMNAFVYHIGRDLHWDGVVWSQVNQRALNHLKFQKIVIHLEYLPDWDPPTDYETACRIKVANIARSFYQIPGLDFEVRNCDQFVDKYNISDVIEPLSSIRNAKSLEFKGISVGLANSSNIFFDISFLATRNSAAECCLHCYGNLLAYAQSLERHPKRRQSMGINSLYFRNWLDWDEHSSFFNSPVITSLQWAREAASEENRYMYRFHRENSLHHLDIHYAQIKAEKRILFSAIDHFQRNEGATRAQALCTFFFQDPSSMAGFNAFHALTCFAVSFRRPVSVITNVVQQGAQSDAHLYHGMEPERTLRRMYAAWRLEKNLSPAQRQARSIAHRLDGSYDWTICAAIFKSALYIMLKMYDNILHCRSQLFTDDIEMDMAYLVSRQEAQDSADTVYSDGDIDKPPMEFDAFEVVFGSLSPLPNLANPFLAKANLLAVNESLSSSTDTDRAYKACSNVS